MSPSRISSLLAVPVLGAAILLPGCGGGGGSGGSSASATATDRFQIQDVTYGRLLEESTGMRVVSPLATVETDPLTGNVIPGTLSVLSANVDVNRLISLNLGTGYVPRVVPRNGVIVASFTRNIDESTVFQDVADADGVVLEPGSVQIRFQDGRAVPVELLVMNGNQIWINPVTDDTIGFPASPVDFGPNGEPRADAVGFLNLWFDRGIIRTTEGEELRARDDRLGTAPTLKIGFNPGNQVLDFVSQSELIPTNETFNGFLPDSTAPAIIRDYVLNAKLDASNGDSANATSVTIANAKFATTARSGEGEWAGEQLVIRPGKNNSETLTILRNTDETLLVAGAFQQPLRDGEEYEIRRIEFFEPAPDTPIKPSRFDPNNPQNNNNKVFLNFVQAYEIDDEGNRVGGPLNLRSDDLPAFSELAVRFNEPIDERSVGQWENFRVAFDPDEGAEKVTRIVMSRDQREVRIQPVREDQDSGAFEVVGWGPGRQALQLILQTVPSVDFLLARLESEDVTAFVEQGQRAITDLGGKPLGFPLSQFDKDAPAFHYQVNFFSNDTISSLDTPPVSKDWSMLVHRFTGKPKTGTDPNTEEPGVRFGDQNNLYSPIADVNLQVNGFLAGQPVIQTTKILDDFFPPPDGQFGAFPSGSATPLVAGSRDAAVPPNTVSFPLGHYGARFQIVYRDVDASPGLSLAGTLLDLERISFAPAGGNVSRDVYEDISIHAGHSPIRPITEQNGASATEPNLGLHEAFDWESYLQDALSTVDPTEDQACRMRSTVLAPNVYEGSLVTCVPPGTRFVIQQKDIYTPPFNNRAYLPFPEFSETFQYNNGSIPASHVKMRNDFNRMINDMGGPAQYWRERRSRGEGDSLLIEYRIRTQRTNISGNNSFTFAPGILLTGKPNFRVFNTGTNNNDVVNNLLIPRPGLDPDNIEGDHRARCSNGYAVEYNASPPQGGADDFRRIDWRAARGDNSRYFMVFDYVKTTSTIRSPYVRGGNGPQYFPAFIDPPPESQPAGTQVVVEYRGGRNFRGAGNQSWSFDPTEHSGWNFLAFRVTFRGNRDTRLSPNFETLAIPVLAE